MVSEKARSGSDLVCCFSWCTCNSFCSWNLYIIVVTAGIRRMAPFYNPCVFLLFTMHSPSHFLETTALICLQLNQRKTLIVCRYDGWLLCVFGTWLHHGRDCYCFHPMTWQRGWRELFKTNFRPPRWLIIVIISIFDRRAKGEVETTTKHDERNGNVDDDRHGSW